MKVCLILGLATLCCGCVVFPHAVLQAPAAEGTVLDGETRKPVEGAAVTRRIVRLNRKCVTATDAQGRFKFKEDKDCAWLVGVDYAASVIEYRIETATYRLFETNLHGGGSLYRGTMPHSLGIVLLEPDR